MPHGTHEGGYGVDRRWSDRVRPALSLIPQSNSREHPVQIPRIDPKNALGLVDKVIGLGKEIVGTLTNRDRLTKSGQIQQEKATERIKAMKAELDAQAHKGKAAAAGRAQKSAQNAKQSVNS